MLADDLFEGCEFATERNPRLLDVLFEDQSKADQKPLSFGVVLCGNSLLTQVPQPIRCVTPHAANVSARDAEKIRRIPYC
jgi:hypothetical protein